MSLRLHEVHPSLVHFPLALAPASVALDALGRITGSRPLMQTGRYLMPAAAVSGVITGLAGLVAQQAVRAEGQAHDTLVTHRNLNVVLVSLTGALAVVRMSRERPGVGYLLAGLAGVAAMNYTSYLGGKMVYTHGVGVESARGVRRSDSPEIRRGSYGSSLRLAGRYIVYGLRRMMGELFRGEIAPLLVGRGAAARRHREIPTSAEYHREQFRREQYAGAAYAPRPDGEAYGSAPSATEPGRMQPPGAMPPGAMSPGDVPRGP